MGYHVRVSLHGRTRNLKSVFPPSIDRHNNLVVYPPDVLQVVYARGTWTSCQYKENPNESEV